MTTTSDTASGLREELGQYTAHVADTLKGRATQEAETRKVAATGIVGYASGALGKAVDDLRGNPDAPEWMAKGLQQVAQQIDRFAGELQGRSVEDMTRDAARLARDNPGTFLAAAAAAGFAAARLLRAGADHKRHAQGGEMSSQSRAYSGDQSYGDAGMWPADENVMPTDTGTGFAPSYGAEGGTIR
jgi:hypothetical protein